MSEVAECVGVMMSVTVLSVVVRRGAVGADDSRRLSVPGSRQLGHCQVPRLGQTNASADLLPGRAVRIYTHSTRYTQPTQSPSILL